MLDVLGDIRNAYRVASKNRGQTLLITTMLALATGITTLGFSFADTALLRGLPIAEPDRTVIVYGINDAEPGRRGGVFTSDVLDLTARAKSVEQWSTWTQDRATLARGTGEPTRITISKVSGDLFSVWGLQTLAGRGLRGDDATIGRPPVAVLSNRLWREMFGSAPTAVGETIIIDRTAHEIVGVLTPDVEWGSFANIGVWVSSPLIRTTARDLSPVMATGRLAGGATLPNAEAELRTIAQSLEAEHPETNRGRSVLPLGADRAMGGPNMILVMVLLVGTAALVTLVASINVAGVLLARAVSRQAEFGLRLALGAGGKRVFRQLLAEGGLLAVLGAIGGLFVAEAGLRLVRSVDAQPILQQIAIDSHEVIFLIALSAVAPLLFSLAPAITAIRTDLAAVLNAGSQRTVGSGRRLRDALVVAQLALAVTLAIVAGLFVRTVGTISSEPLGFSSVNLMKFSLSLDQGTLDAAGRRSLVSAVLDELRSTRGDFTVGALGQLPAIETESSSTIELAGEAADSGSARLAHVTTMEAGALATLGVPVLEGRSFDRRDVESDRDVALLSAEAARRFFGGARAAVGRQVTVRNGQARRTYEVVGVTGDVHSDDRDYGMPSRVWVPLANPGSVAFLVRTTAESTTTASAIRSAVRKVMPGVPVESLESYDEANSRKMGGLRVAIGMLTAFAAAALLFAAAGLYSTVALSAHMRRAEFAIRVALGAKMQEIATLVVSQAAKMLAVGLVLGIVGGVLAGSAMRRVLYGVTPLDMANLLGVTVVLTFVSVAATLLPAMRAAKVDPMTTIRER